MTFPLPSFLIFSFRRLSAFSFCEGTMKLLNSVTDLWNQSSNEVP